MKLGCSQIAAPFAAIARPSARFAAFPPATNGGRTFPNFRHRLTIFWPSPAAHYCFFDVRGIKIPVAVSAFAEEIYQAPKSWAEKAYPKLIHFNSFPKGTHFAAGEQR